MAAFLLVFGLLPLANWIPGGHSATWFGVVAADLLTGLSVALGAGIVVGILAGKIRFRAVGARLDLSAAIERRWAVGVGGLVLGAFGLYLLVSIAAFSARPLLIDEIIQVVQARILAAGKLWVPAEPHQFFFSSMHLVEQEGRVYGQFPIGGPAMLALGSLVRGEWLVNPVFGALSVGLFGALVRRVEPRAGTALLATGLFALAPFAVFMSASHMNHVPTLLWLLIGMVGLVRSVSPSGRWLDGLVCGLGFGLAATIRPADAMAFAAPAGVWLLARAGSRTERRVGPLLGAGLGVALPLLALAWVNLETTGAPLRFGYTVLWGRAHDLGFHGTPWGPTHTPARGIELINVFFLRLQSYLFEAAGPSLLPATAALALARRLTPFDRYLLVGSVLLVGFYFAYWHDGFYLGPRFMYPLLPVLVLWTARLPAVLEARHTRTERGEPPTGESRPGSALWPTVRRAVLATIVIGAVLGLATSVPLRLSQYRGGLISLRWNADRAAAHSGITNALVLVRESWGAELVARMWALGVPRSDAETIYRAADPCRLDLSLGALEPAGIRGAAAAAALEPLLADSTRPAQPEAATGDPTLRLTPGVTYPPDCNAKIQANLTGFTLYPPLLLARQPDNVYARDLGARDSLLLEDYPGRAIYLLKPDSRAVGADPVFHRLDPDSLLREWRGASRK